MATKAANEPWFNCRTIESDNTTVISWWNLSAAGVDSGILNIIRQLFHHVSSSILRSLLRNSILLHRLFEIGKTKEATKTEETSRVEEVGRETKETLGGGGVVSVDAADWDSLPEGVMIERAERIDFYGDFEVMDKLSRRWGSAMRMADFRCGGKSIQFPWLMHTSDERDKTLFYSFSRNMLRSVALPDAINGRMVRLHSSHGWLLIIPSWECSLSLFNPLSRTYIQLPDNSSLDYETDVLEFPFFVERFCLSYSPSTNPDDFQVMIITGRQYELALWRPGNGDWTPGETSPLDSIPDTSFTDLTYIEASSL